MDNVGRLTDELGRRIEIGMQVREVDDRKRTGRVTSLGSIATGEITVEFRTNGKPLGLVPVRATAVRIVYGNEALERLRNSAAASGLATVIVATADLRLLLDKLPSGNPAVDRLRQLVAPRMSTVCVVPTADLRHVLDLVDDSLFEGLPDE